MGENIELDRQRIRFIFHVLTKDHLDNLNDERSNESEDINKATIRRMIEYHHEAVGISFKYLVNANDCIIKIRSMGSNGRVHNCYSAMEFYGLIDNVEYLLFSVKVKNITLDNTEEDCEILLCEDADYLFQNKIKPINNLLIETSNILEEENLGELNDFLKRDENSVYKSNINKFIDKYFK